MQQVATPAPRLTLKKERLVCLTTLYSQTTAPANGRTITSILTGINY